MLLTTVIGETTLQSNPSHALLWLLSEPEESPVLPPRQLTLPAGEPTTVGQSGYEKKALQSAKGFTQNCPCTHQVECDQLPWNVCSYQGAA